MLWAHTIGLAAIGIAAPFIADSWSWRDLLLGALAGLVGLVGLLLLYQGLSRGPMAVVAPLSAITSALVPVVANVGSDDALNARTGIGLAVGLAAVAAISWEGNLDPDGPAVTPRVILEAIVAGSCFGSLVLLYEFTDEAAAPWPVVSGRVVTVGLLLAIALIRRHQIVLRSDRAPATAAGLGDTFANMTLLIATTTATSGAELSAVAVLAAFFPAATVLWARLLLQEPLGRMRLFGLALGLVAIALLTV